MSNLVMIRKREDGKNRWLEIVVVGENVSVHKHSMSWDLNQVKRWL